MFRILLCVFFAALSVCNLYAQRGKMSPFVRQAARDAAVEGSVSSSKGVGTSSSSCLTAFVKASDASVFPKHGCSILAQWDDIYIAAIPLHEIQSLAAETHVARIEAGKSCMPTNDKSAVVTHAAEAWGNAAAGRGFTGKGVVVGVMDIGYDLTHPAFYSPDGGTYRVKRLWDMLDMTEEGEPVVGTPIPDGYFVGRQYTSQEALLRKQHSSDIKTQVHGTHTAATAAGSGAPFLCKDGDPLYSGMAPEAEICLVANMVSDNFSYVPQTEYYKYTMATDMLGFKYIFDYAESVGKPCVINFSEGSHDDLYQSGIYSAVMKKLVGPGRILCASAGNEAGKGTSVHKAKGTVKKGAFLRSSDKMALYVLRSQQPPVINLRFYGSGSSYEEWCYDAEQLREYPDSVFMDTLAINGKKFVAILNTYPSCYNEMEFATDFAVVDLSASYLGSTPVALILTGTDNDIEAVASGGYFVSDARDSSLRDYTNARSVLFPGSLDDVICVGAMGYRKGFTNILGNWINPSGMTFAEGEIYEKSGRGPSMNNHIKPDVMAPGVNVLSASNVFYSEKNPWIYSWTAYEQSINGHDYGYISMTGTSMATPVVTGIVAMWLQACPTLSPDDVRDVIAHTSSHTGDILTWPNNTYGNGEINAVAGLDYILKKYYDRADVNKDGETDVKDINAVISTLSGSAVYADYSDVNNDGIVDVKDINAIINVLSKN